jgi:Mg-chelatase subunit ChlD
MKRILPIAVLLVLALGVPLTQSSAEESRPRGPAVEVVFVLDTTGSMSNLLEGAKQKIWSIANHIASGRPTPLVRIGLVAYRDRGDAYVTCRFDLTEDLDAVYSALRGYRAGGGGDGPESVNQALHEAVTCIRWSKDASTLRMIYLVGDAPPHMDYANEVQYPKTCRTAVAAGILINTVQCGTWGETRTVWQTIARSAEGTYLAIGQGGGMTMVSTPFDKKLAEVSRKMSKTYLAYESKGRRVVLKEKMRKAEADAADAPAGAAADRAGFRAKSGRIGSSDLIAMLLDKSLTFDKIKEKYLPEHLKKLGPDELKRLLQARMAQRQLLVGEAKQLSKQRDTFLRAWHEKHRAGGKKAFDVEVIRTLKKAAKKIGITYD